MLIPINESGKPKKVYLRITNGSIINKTKDGQTLSYSAISGALRRIELKEHEFENKKFRNWHVILSDTQSGEEYDISVGRTSGAFKGIIRSLVTEQGLANLDDITIEAYLSKTGYTNASVSAGGQRLQWTDEPMPERALVRVGDNEMVDDTAQMNWIQTLVDRVNAKLSSAEEAPAPAEEEDDLPEEFAE